MKTLRDPVHGDIQLSDLEIEVMDTPEFQRLRGIRQLGTSYLVFPGAQHTRFEHSVGTCWLLKQLVKEINQRAGTLSKPPIDAEMRDFLSLAALLHDITHIPFGHTLEDERRILPAHDKNKARLNYFLETPGLGRVLAESGYRDQLVTFFSEGKQWRPEYGFDLVAGPICADLLDYMKRDAFFCGLKLDYDSRLFRYLSIEGDRLCFNLYSGRGFRQDAWTELINLLRMRFHLTERVYFHHAKVAAGAMISRLLEELLLHDAFELQELYELQDDSFMYLLGKRVSKVRPFKPLWDAIRARRLYQRVYMVGRDPLVPDFPPQEFMDRVQDQFHLNKHSARSELEKHIAKALRVPQCAVILYAPDTAMNLKEASVTVRVDSGPLVQLSEFHHPELDALRNGHRAIWRFYLFLDRAYEHKALKAAQLLEDELGLPNQLELMHRGQLTFRF